jgi:ubiquinone biosynthesis protein UbiJ
MSRGYSKPASTKEKEIADLEAEVRVLKHQVEAEKRRVAQLELQILREGTSK